jgi:uncharacterized protein (DUF4415 family)
MRARRGIAHAISKPIRQEKVSVSVFPPCLGKVLVIAYTVREKDDEKVMRMISARRARRKERKNTKSKKIGFSDILELSDKQLARMRRVGRPTVGDEPRKLIAIRLDAKVLSWLRETAEKKGKPYQSLVNEILAEEMRKAS